MRARTGALVAISVFAGLLAVLLARRGERNSVAVEVSFEGRAPVQHVPATLAEASGPDVEEEGARASAPATTERSPVTRESAYFHGLVLDGLRGAPLAQARAEVRHGRLVFEGDSIPPSLLVSAAATSGTDGIFRLEHDDPELAARGLLWRDGYGARSFQVEPGHDTRARASVIELLPCASLEIEVRDERGEPLEGIGIELSGPPAKPHRSGASPPDGPVWRSATDERGSARFACLPAEVPFHLGLQAERSTRMLLALAPREQRRIELVSGFAVLRGIIRDDAGAPLSAYRLELARPHPDATRSFLDKARTDEQGRFEFPAVAYGEWTLGAPFGPRSRVVVDGPVVEVERSGVRGRPLEGRVVHEGSRADEPFDEVEVRARPVRDPSTTFDAEVSIRDGHFSFDALPPGEYELRAIEPGGGSEGVLASAGERDLRLFIVTRVSVKVACAGFGDGELLVMDRMRGVSFASDVRDDVADLMLAPGAYGLWLESSGGRVAFLPELLVGRVAAPLEVGLELRPSATLTLAARPETGGVLRLRAAGGLLLERYLVACEGVTCRVPSGSIEVEFEEPFDSLRRELVLAEDDRRRIELPLR